MGEFYQDGDGVNVDMQKAVHYYQVSAAQRYWRAEFLVGIASELGTGIPRNRAMAIVMLNRAADDGQSGLAQQLVTMLRCSVVGQFELQESNDLFDRPDVIGNSGSHGGRHSEGLVLTPKVVIHEVQSNRRSVILDLL
jgi:hypothetical protein